MAERLLTVRLDERHCASGPVIYESHAWWDTGEHRVKQFHTRSEAQQYISGLLEGVNEGDFRKTVFEWNFNDNGD